MRLWGGELLLRDGEPAGSISSAAYGHTLGGAVALGYVQRADAVVDKAYLTEAEYQVDVAGERHDATVHLTAPYDPRSLKVKA